MRVLALLLTTALLSVGLAAGQETDAASNGPPQAPAMQVALTADCGGQPCGFITPILSLEFPTKQSCGGYRYIFEDATPTDCDVLMPVGESMTYEGYITFSWDCAEEPTYPIDPTQTIDFEFGKTANNPEWIDVAFDPPSFQFTVQDLYDSQFYDVDAERNPVCWYEYTHDLDVTFTRTGDMDKTWASKVAGWNGLLKMFIKAKSSAVDPHYRESYGVEEFRWRACQELSRGCPNTVDGETPRSQDPVDNDTPALPMVAALGVLAALAIMRRRL